MRANGVFVPSILALLIVLSAMSSSTASAQTARGAKESDPVINGALIGAGAAVASGLFLCRATETWANCRDDVGPMLRIGAVGAVAGAGIDALIRRRKAGPTADPGFARLRALPIVAGGAAGLQVSLHF